ncbi:hypothetical protein HYD58_00835 [Mycoplasmopsis bovis]|nr:hypothetical protein HYD58_00835 [Mycoplasmopsis bovis]
MRNLELAFSNSLKMCLNKTNANVQGNYRLLATEFINFLSSIIALQNIKPFLNSGIIDN